MATPFIAAIEPPIDLVPWIPSLPSAQQNQTSLPRTFLDAMEVREEVYVKEQKVPQEFEFDEDDTRAAHWVIYASINQTIEPAITDPSTGEILRPRRSESRAMPIGTVRLVPFPHPPHPRKGGIYVGGKLINAGDPVAKVGEVTITDNGITTPTKPQDQTQEEDIVQPLTPYETRRLSAPIVPFAIDPPTVYHDGVEPYVKLGRLAVIKEFRGRGIAGQLISAATDWMLKHKTYFNPSAAAVGFEHLGMMDGRAGSGKLVRDVPKWRGLFCCHAQEEAIGLWEKHGFKVDEAMGRWVEEGIPHVGMFYRAPMNKEKESVA